MPTRCSATPRTHPRQPLHRQGRVARSPPPAPLTATTAPDAPTPSYQATQRLLPPHASASLARDVQARARSTGCLQIQREIFQG